MKEKWDKIPPACIKRGGGGDFLSFPQKQSFKIGRIG